MTTKKIEELVGNLNFLLAQINVFEKYGLNKNLFLAWLRVAALHISSDDDSIFPLIWATDNEIFVEWYFDKYIVSLSNDLAIDFDNMDLFVYNKETKEDKYELVSCREMSRFVDLLNNFCEDKR